MHILNVKPGRLAFVIHTNLEFQLYFAVLEGFFLQLLLMTCSEDALKYEILHLLSHLD